MAGFGGNSHETGEPAPLGTVEEFAELVGDLVADSAPRVFALVEECGERADGWIAAWGMQFEDHAEVVAADRGLRISVPSAEGARSMLARLGRIRLVWCQHEALPSPPTLECSERSTGTPSARKIGRLLPGDHRAATEEDR